MRALTRWKNPGYLDTLSVASAEVGDFEQAIRWQRKALEDPAYVKEEGGNAKQKLPAVFSVSSNPSGSDPIGQSPPNRSYGR